MTVLKASVVCIVRSVRAAAAAGSTAKAAAASIDSVAAAGEAKAAIIPRSKCEDLLDTLEKESASECLVFNIILLIFTRKAEKNTSTMCVRGLQAALATAVAAV